MSTKDTLKCHRYPVLIFRRQLKHRKWSWRALRATIAANQQYTMSNAQDLLSILNASRAANPRPAAAATTSGSTE